MTCHRSALTLSLLLSGCAGAPTLKLLDYIPPPPRDAAAATARCPAHRDDGLAQVAAELAALRSQEQTDYARITASAQAAEEDGTGYAKRYPQAARALTLHAADIHQAAMELSVRMDQSAGAYKRTLEDALDTIDGAERPKLAACVLTWQDGRWQPQADCAAPVRGAARAARIAAVDGYLDSAQQVWEGWRRDAETTMQDWTKLPQDTPEADDVYVQVALAGYRHSQQDMLQQLMRASTNLCSIAAKAVDRPDPVD